MQVSSGAAKVGARHGVSSWPLSVRNRAPSQSVTQSLATIDSHAGSGACRILTFDADCWSSGDEFWGHHTELHPVLARARAFRGQGAASATDRPHGIITPPASTAIGEPLSRPSASVQKSCRARDPSLPKPVTTLISSLPNPVTTLTSSLPNPVTTRTMPGLKTTLPTGRVAVPPGPGCGCPVAGRSEIPSPSRGPLQNSLIVIP